jgi:glycosidase
VLGNHDRPRVAAMLLLLLTLRGTPTLHYGDELGLSDVAIPPAQVQDPRELREPGLALAAIRSARASPRPSHGCLDAYIAVTSLTDCLRDQ